jgi:hypothetical protein
VWINQQPLNLFFNLLLALDFSKRINCAMPRKPKGKPYHDGSYRSLTESADTSLRYSFCRKSQERVGKLIALKHPVNYSEAPDKSHYRSICQRLLRIIAVTNLGIGVQGIYRPLATVYNVRTLLAAEQQRVDCVKINRRLMWS